MKHLAAAALTATLLAGSAVAALAQTATPTTNSPAPAASAATTTPAPAASQPMTPAKTMPMAAAKPAMHRKAQRVAERRFEHAGDPDTKALNLLEAAGYTDIKSFRSVGASFEASVDQNGKLITVTVDPGTGQITNHA